MKVLLHISDHHDSYEILLEGRAILRITKFTNDAQIPRNVRFDDLSEEAKERLLKAINNHK